MLAKDYRQIEKIKIQKYYKKKIYLFYDQIKNIKLYYRINIR